MEINDIIILDNKAKYCILKDLIIDNGRYFMCSLVDDEGNISEKNLAFLREIKKKNDNYVEVIREYKQIDRLAKAFMQALKDAE